MLLLLEDNLFPYLLNEDFRMLHVVTTGAYYPPVVTTGFDFDYRSILVNSGTIVQWANLGGEAR